MLLIISWRRDYGKDYRGDLMIGCDWAKSEFDGINPGDKRLNERLVKITNQFISCTESPINQACNSWADTKAAYRFFRKRQRISVLDCFLTSCSMAAMLQVFREYRQRQYA